MTDATMVAEEPVSTADAATGGAGGGPKGKVLRSAKYAGMTPRHVVEAALFSAGKPIAVEEIAQETHLSPETITKGLKELQAAYAERDSVLEVGKAGMKWAMQVRAQAAEPAARFAAMEIAPKLLKTLALIAYHQPLKQSQLVDMIGTKVYDHIPELVERGLVRAREEGVTKILTTTAAFPEYFGLDAANQDEVRRVMGRLVGIEAPDRKAEPRQAEIPADAPSEPGGEAGGDASGETGAAAPAESPSEGEGHQNPPPTPESS